MNSLTLQSAGDLAKKVAALSSADFYDDSCTHVDRIETHMSWVFLTTHHAYKLKKPVWWSDLDFRTLAAREHFCREELRLNRRLAPTVYLDVIPLRHKTGRFQLGGNDGEIVDYLVKMIRLPAEKMLDRQICNKSIEPENIRSLAMVLTEFYRHATRIKIEPEHYSERIAAAIFRSYAELSSLQYELPRDRLHSIVGVLLNYLDTASELRARAEHVVDAHGDLRPEHIYLGEPIQIIDCLEFQHRLRELDPVDELAFLALECARLGASHVGRAILRMYRVLTSDTFTVDLVAFYQSHRALTRAVLAIRHLDDPLVLDRKKWRERALLYIAMAEHASKRF